MIKQYRSTLFHPANIGIAEVTRTRSDKVLTDIDMEYENFANLSLFALCDLPAGSIVLHPTLVTVPKRIAKRYSFTSVHGSRSSLACGLSRLAEVSSFCVTTHRCLYICSIPVRLRWSWSIWEGAIEM